MANTTSTTLKLTVQATGENSGTWGQFTNTNLLILEQAIGGYDAVGVTSGATLTFSNGVLSNGKNQVLKLIGTITGNVNVTIPDGIEKTYIVDNATTGAHTVTFKTSSGSGVTWSATDKTTKIVYTDGTDVIDVPLGIPGGSDTQVQFNNSGVFGGSANLIWDGSNLTIGAQGDLRLADSAGGEYVALQAPSTVSSNITFTLPGADGTADQVLKTNGSGVLSFGDVVGGESWQAVKTGNFTAVAGEGYFINTTSGAITMTLPATPTLGDEVSVIDYAGTFDTNNLTVGRNSENIQGSAADLTVATERAGFTLVYTDGTQGWLLKNN